MIPSFSVRTSLTFVLTLAVVFGFCQTPPQDGVEQKKDANGAVTSEMTYAGGKLNGPFRLVRNDTLIEGSYLNDQLDGIYKRFIVAPGMPAVSPNLTPELVGLYRKGLPTGIWKYYRNNRLFLEGLYLNGLPTGIWKEYGWKLSGTGTILFVETEYDKGKRDGVQETYFRYLKKEVTCSDEPATPPCFAYSKGFYRETKYYEDNVLQGTYERIDQNGQTILTGNYVDGEKNRLWVETKDDRIYYYDYSSGKINGYATVRDKDGHIRSKGIYKDDIKHGEWLAYFPDGKLQSSEKYEQGKLIGTRTELDERGKKVATQTFDKGRLDVFSEYDANGENIVRSYKIIEFKGDKVISQMTFHRADTTRQATYSVPLPESERASVYLAFQERFLKQTNGGKNNQHGPIELIVADTVFVSGNFKRDKKDGPWIVYSYPGPIAWESIFRNGRFIKEVFKDEAGKPFSGKFNLYHQNGTLQSEFKVKGGLRSGKSLYWDEAGKLLKEEKYNSGRLE